MSNDPLAARPVRVETAGASAETAPRPVELEPQSRITTAVVEEISPEGVARVMISGEFHAQQAVTVVHYGSATAASAALLRQTVLVLVHRVGPPVIMGVVGSRLWPAAPELPVEAETTVDPLAPRVAQLDKRRVELEASDEIRLTCGKSSFVMRRDGTVIVRGVKIVSRAIESNKIRGGTIALN